MTNQLEHVNAGALAKAEWLADRDTMVSQMALVTEVESDEALRSSASLQKKAKKALKALSSDRLGLTRKLDSVKREIMDQERDLSGPLSDQLVRIKTLNDRYATRKAAEAQRIANEQRRLQKEADSKAFQEQQEHEAKVRELFGDAVCRILTEASNPEPIQQAPVPSARTNLKGAGRQVTRWSFEVVDSAKVPREQCSVDSSKINAKMKYMISMGQDPEIPGIRFEKKISVEG